MKLISLVIYIFFISPTGVYSRDDKNKNLVLSLILSPRLISFFILFSLQFLFLSFSALYFFLSFFLSLTTTTPTFLDQLIRSPCCCFFRRARFRGKREREREKLAGKIFRRINRG